MKTREKNTRLAEERLRRRWTQSEVAERTGTTTVNVNRWEKGKTRPGPYYRQALVTLFGMSEEELGLTTPPGPADSSVSEEIQMTDYSSVEQLPFPSTPPSYVQHSPTVLPRASGTAKQPGRFRKALLLLVLVLVVFTSTGLGLLYLSQLSPSLPPSVGYLRFLSSRQVSDTSNEGIADEVQVEVSPLENPQAGKSYYVWLLPDEKQPENTIFLLGKMKLSGKKGNLSYSGDAHYTNLLAVTSRLLVTEESTAVEPIAPSMDKRNWRYTGQIPNRLSAGETHGFLDHLRHLLAFEPTLSAHQLSGGLTPWLHRKTQAVYAKALRARDSWQATGTTRTTVVRQDVISILYNLDGVNFVSTDLPTTLPPSFTPTDTHMSSIGLLQLHANQDPPGYLYHVSLHLSGLLSSEDATLSLQEHITQIIPAINTVNSWLQQVRKDAKQLVAMTDGELQQTQASVLLNNMVVNANYALVGQTAATGNTQEGVESIMKAIESLAIMEIIPYSAY